jgi:uncharacterized membrane protein
MPQTLRPESQSPESQSPESPRNTILHYLRVAAIAAVLITYALLAHHVNASSQASALGAALALAPLLLLSAAMAFKAESRTTGIILLLAISGTALIKWPVIEQHAGIIFWLQDISLMLVLFVTFGRTLIKGRKPLCVGFAEAMNGGKLPLSHWRYAYWVTVAWVAFFGLMAVISTALFFGASMASWSVFVNFLTLPLVALMFVIEYLVRRAVLPDAPSAHILAAVKAYRNMALRKH